MKITRILSALIFLVAPLGYAGTYTAATCSRADVNAVINGPTHTAVDGDVIQSPSGTCTWTSGITVPSNIGITIIGSGTPNSGSSTTGASSSCSTGTTIIIAGNFTAFAMTPHYGNSTSRISCFNITYSSGSPIGFDVLGVPTSSGSPNLRIDNITINSWNGVSNAISGSIAAIGDMYGVLDHNTYNGVSGTGCRFVQQSNASYLGVGSYGDNTWAQPEAYGTAAFLFYENNTLNYCGMTETEGTAGTQVNQGGMRGVIRYNTFNVDNTNDAMSWHGTESNGRPRSTRAWEFYGNTINCPPSTGCQAPIGSRGGTGLTWGNTEVFGSSSFQGTFLGMDTYRAQGSVGGWGACDGSTGYDTNDGTSYYSGTISNWNSGTSTITVSGSPGWTTNQWVSNGSPYSIHDVTQNSGSEIASNASGTITLVSGGGPGSYVPVNGDSIQILRATVCIDQAGGRGAGILYDSACSPAGINSPTCTVTAASEALSPAYLWELTITGASLGVGPVYSDTARIIANRDWYTESENQAAQSSATSPFNGTSGMGHGTLAREPSTCTSGVGYFATDVGPQGTLYLCTSTNTWTLKYAAYTYPHPLDSGGTTYTWTPTIVGSGSLTGSNCSSASYSSGTTIGACTAVPGTGYSFTGWSSVSGSAACSGSTNPCPSFSITANSAATATFTANSTGAAPQLLLATLHKGGI